MAKQHVVATVRAVLDGWDPTSGGLVTTKPVIVYPNGDGEPPPPPEPYLFVQFPVANAQRTSHSLSFVEEGAARIVILASIATGGDWANRISEELASLFRAKKIAGIEFLVPTSPRVDDKNDQGDGNYVLGSVVIPYLYHFDDPE